MEKTLTISLSNMVFHIEKAAYEKLKDYLDAIKLKLINDEGQREIMEDIESRISEIFLSRKATGHQIITVGDVQEVISTLGNAEDFDDEPAGANNPQPEHLFQRTSKRLYRDPDNSILGGVCAGMGAYFNTDMVLFRILFIVLIIAGGSGLLIYIVLWIVVPEARTTAQKLEMRGERINLQNIKNAFREEFNNVKKNMKF